MLKVLERSGIQVSYVNVRKATYIKANIRLNGKKLKAIAIKSGTRLAGAVKQQRGQKNINWKGRSQNITICR